MQAFDPTDPRLSRAPDLFWPLFRQLEEPVPAGRTSIALWRHASVSALLKPGPGEALKCPERALRGFPAGPFRTHNAATMAFLDPPRHGLVRRAFARPLAPTAVEPLAPLIADLSDRLLAGLDAETDLAAAYAERLPLMVVAHILGVPADGEALLRRSAHAIVRGLEPGASAAALVAADRAVADLTALLESRAATHSHSLLAQLMETAAGQSVSAEERLHNAIFLLNAGHETTTRLIAGLAARLLGDPALAKGATGPGRAAELVEEQLRLDPPLAFVPRYLGQPLAGQPAGTRIFLLIAAANRDPARFAEPDRFLPGRPNGADHLSFLSGRHLCLGASLARLEARIAVMQLAALLPRWRLAGAVRRTDGRIFQGIDRLPVCSAC